VFNHQRPFIVFGVEEKISKWTQKVKHGEIDPISLWHTSHWCKKCSLAAPVQWLLLVSGF
jgi:hypothetical protein